jgi:hypothetical protein
MYRQTSPQTSLLEPQFLIPGLLPDDDWSFIYRDKIWPLIDENQFKHLYQEEGGAPNKSIKLKVSLLIFMALEKFNWRQVEFMFMRRLDWINATFTVFGNANIDHTTLFKFYQQLEDDPSAYQLFVALTNTFIEECNVSTKKQRVDSFFMLGWLATLSRYGLFKETMRVFLQALRKHKPGLYDNIKNELSRDYLQDNFDLTEKDKEKTRVILKEMAVDLYRLKSSFEHHAQVKHYGTFQTLSQVFEQQCLIKTKPEEKQDSPNELISKKEIVVVPTEDTNDSGSAFHGSLPEIEIREKPAGKKIISTPHNTDAEYTRKRKQTVVGHKGFIAETCDPDNAVQFITDANLEAATFADAKEIPNIVERLEDNSLAPETLYGDAGFVNGTSILDCADRGIDLAGPSSGRSQSFEGFHREDRPFDVNDFTIKIDDETKELSVISCPKQQKVLDQQRSDKTGRMLVHFSSDICKACSSQGRCPVKKGVQTSTLDVSEAQYAGAARHHKYMGNADYRKECGIRAGAESLMNEVANGHGARQSKHKTEQRSRLQLLFACIGCNVKRYLRYTQSCVQNQAELAI